MTADDSGTRSSAGSNAGTFRALREIILVVVVVVAFGGALFHGLGRTDLRNDEAIYAFAVDRILETGNWLSPESIPHSDLPGDPAARGVETFLEKPPLKFWFVAAPISLGLLPHNEFGLRFWDAAFGTLAFLYVYLIGRPPVQASKTTRSRSITRTVGTRETRSSSASDKGTGARVRMAPRRAPHCVGVIDNTVRLLSLRQRN